MQYFYAYEILLCSIGQQSPGRSTFHELLDFSNEPIVRAFSFLLLSLQPLVPLLFLNSEVMEFFGGQYLSVHDGIIQKCAHGNIFAV